MPSATDATASTVSIPLSLDSLRSQNIGGEEVDGKRQVNGDQANGAKRRKVKPEMRATLTSLTVNNLGTLKRLINVVCPTRYSDAFYKTMLDPSLDDINKLIYYADIPVGAILCRMAAKAKPTDEDVLEILAVVVLAPYRSLSLGTALLSNAITVASTTSTQSAPATKTSQATGGRKKATKAALHVQEGNEDAKRFYVEKFGFEVVRLQEDYYKSVTPSGAWILEKKLD